MEDKIVITMPDKVFMHVKMIDGKAEIWFADSCNYSHDTYVLECSDGALWHLPVEKGDQ
jgi:hypothetical protein